jgi:hypothetical protein
MTDDATNPRPPAPLRCLFPLMQQAATTDRATAEEAVEACISARITANRRPATIVDARQKLDSFAGDDPCISGTSALAQATSAQPPA